jgi:DNA repair protein RadD
LNEKQVHAARDYQQTLIDAPQAFWAAGGQNCLAVLPTGGGKCLGRGTPVLLHDGRVVPVEEVRVGDRLMGPDGTARTVRSLARGSERMYRIVPTKGDSYVVNESHVLSLKTTPVRSNPKYACQTGGRVVNISVRDYLSRSKTFKHTHKGWRTGVDFPPAASPVPLDPYFLGVWLGDGNSHNATVTTGDEEVLSFLRAHAERVGMRFATSPNSPGSVLAKTLGLSRAGRGGTPLMNTLRALGVVNDKHIPFAYKTASREDRLRLLAGLVDSDGHYSGKGYGVTLGNERLLDDLVFVARSLGLAAYKSPVSKTCTNNGVAGTYWHASISGDLDMVPCLIARKQARPRRQIKNVLVTGIRVEPLGPGEYFGFEIDGDRLFLLGDFTVTHNTFVFSRIAAAVQGGVCAIAHRSELVSQISLALAREGVRHRVIGPAAVAQRCTQAHLLELGQNFVSPNAFVAVAGVDTLIRMDPKDPWFAQVALWIQDEAHHVLKDNKWGKAAAMFPRARGLGVTATPMRADGKGLGRHADGLFDEMFVGPSMRDLIGRGYLTEYRIFAPPSDLDLSTVPISAGGDFSPPKLADARRRSHITGDVVEHYLRIANGKLGVTFDVSVESATETAAAFQAAGIPAEVVSANTPDDVRARVLSRFRAREVLQLVNVDLFGEGFDLPAIEVVSMARPTQSYGLFAQQFGRALRPLEGKSHAIIIDHVGNALRHGLPDAPREWSLDRRERRSRSARTDVIPTRTCLNTECLAVYERVHKACPYCGHEPVPAGRAAPEQVDGDLTELDPATLAAMRGEQVRVDSAPRIPADSAPWVKGAIEKRHWERQQAQAPLRDAIALWSGWQGHLGRPEHEQYRRFYFRYGVDVGTAQTGRAGSRKPVGTNQR